jgi:hypothetical protein
MWPGPGWSSFYTQHAYNWPTDTDGNPNSFCRLYTHNLCKLSQRTQLLTHDTVLQMWQRAANRATIN